AKRKPEWDEDRPEGMPHDWRHASVDCLEIGQCRQSDHPFLAWGTWNGTNLLFKKIPRRFGRQLPGRQLGPERGGQVVLAVAAKRRYEHRSLYRRCRGIDRVPIKAIWAGEGLPCGPLLGDEHRSLFDGKAT